MSENTDSGINSKFRFQNKVEITFWQSVKVSRQSDKNWGRSSNLNECRRLKNKKMFWHLRFESYPFKSTVLTNKFNLKNRNLPLLFLSDPPGWPPVTPGDKKLPKGPNHHNQVFLKNKFCSKNMWYPLKNMTLERVAI